MSRKAETKPTRAQIEKHVRALLNDMHDQRNNLFGIDEAVMTEKIKVVDDIYDYIKTKR